MNQRLQRLIYEWPMNLVQYEADSFLGLNIIEWMAAGMALLLSLVLVPHPLLKLLFGVAGGACTVLVVKKLERLGNISIPVYLWRRWRARRHPRYARLTEIVGVSGATVHLEEGDGHVVTIE